MNKQYINKFLIEDNLY